MSVGFEYVQLLTPKVLSARRRSAPGRGRWGRFAMILGVGAAAWPVIYVTLARLLRTLRGVEEVGPLLASKLLALALLVFIGMLLLSNLIAALSSFFLSRDLPWIRAAPGGAEMGQDEIWTKSIAVEREDFVRRTQQRIDIKVKGRKVVEMGGAFTPREPIGDYGLYSGPENNPIVPENRYFWDVL